jgi:hypothetical protein
MNPPTATTSGPSAPLAREQLERRLDELALQTRLPSPRPLLAAQRVNDASLLKAIRSLNPGMSREHHRLERLEVADRRIDCGLRGWIIGRVTGLR